MEKLYSPDEAAELLQIHPHTIRKWLRDGKIQGKKFGRVWRIPESELEAVKENK